MPDIRIHRDHALGLPKAREVAWAWAEEVEKKFGMDCTVLEGETSDTVEFTRSGVKGRLIVAADHFDLDAKLGFLLGAVAVGVASVAFAKMADGAQEFYVHTMERMPYAFLILTPLGFGLFAWATARFFPGAQGSGQGLFVAKTYMAKMGGTINARNTADGVAFVVVDALEAVEIDDDDRRRRAVAPAAVLLAVDEFVPGPAVAERRQFVGQRLGAQALGATRGLGGRQILLQDRAEQRREQFEQRLLGAQAVGLRLRIEDSELGWSRHQVIDTLTPRFKPASAAGAAAATAAGSPGWRCRPPARPAGRSSTAAAAAAES